MEQDKQRREGIKTMAGSFRGKNFMTTFNDRDFGSNDPMNKYIGGFSDYSPRTQTDKAIEYMNQIFKQRNFNPVRAFSMADVDRTGYAKFGDVLHCMRKIIPQFDKEFCNRVPAVFNMDSESEISKNEFQLMFDFKGVKMSQSQAIPKSAVKKMNQSERKEAHAQEYWTILKYFAEELQKENITPTRFFKQADSQHNDVLNISDLKDHIKAAMPESFDGLSYKKLVQALDQKDRGYIDLHEFCNLLDESIKRDLDTRNIAKVPQMLNKKKMRDFAKPMANAQTKNIKDKLIKKPDLVLKEDRIDAEEMVKWVENLIDCESRVNEPQDDIKMIFDKITAWKKKNNKNNDSEQLEAFIQKSLKIPKRANGQSVRIHNAKTVTELLKTLQKDIKLTEDELNFMVFTSVDQEYFTHLLIE